MRRSKGPQARLCTCFKCYIWGNLGLKSTGGDSVKFEGPQNLSTVVRRRFVETEAGFSN